MGLLLQIKSTHLNCMMKTFVHMSSTIIRTKRCPTLLRMKVVRFDRDPVVEDNVPLSPIQSIYVPSNHNPQMSPTIAKFQGTVGM